jgi:hypothetical protein
MINKKGDIMNYKAPGKCPVCGNKLTISRLNCHQCGTTLEGQFSPCEFCSLPKEELDFLKTFIKCRGSIKDVEKELGISYPTVKSKLNSLIEALGFHIPEVEAEDLQTEREEAKKRIISDLENGVITAKEATELINRLRRI